MSTFSSIFGGGSIDYWVSGTTYVKGKTVRSPANHQLYVRIVAGAGTTDPASDSTNWRADGKTAIKSIQRGVITISGGAGTNTATATIASVNTEKTELRLLGSYAGGYSDNTFDISTSAYFVLTNSTTITATRRNNTPYSVAHYLSWELTEYY